jgi:hypothetical protein
LLLSISIYVALPLVAGWFSRRWIIAAKGEDWFREKFLHVLTPVTIVALLITLVLLFSFKGEVILANPLTILWIAIPLLIQTCLIFALGYGLARILRLRYEDAAPSAMIGASNHFEVAIATAVMLFGLSSGAALATVVGVLIEVPVMLILVKFCLKSQNWFRSESPSVRVLGFGFVGSLIGGFVGFLGRPAGILAVQVPFEHVITRGVNLKGMDQMLVPLAQQSFNIMLMGTILGAIVGIMIGYFVGKK